MNPIDVQLYTLFWATSSRRGGEQETDEVPIREKLTEFVVAL